MPKQTNISAAEFFDNHYLDAASHITECAADFSLDMFNRELEQQFVSNISDLFCKGASISKYLTALHDTHDNELSAATAQELAATTVQELSSVIWSIEMLLNSYSDNVACDPNAVWSYIAEHRRLSTKSPVSICQDSDHIYIYLPAFPPKGKGNDALINRMLAAKLFSSTERLPTWGKWAAHFHFVYPSAASNTARDVDNYDYKRTIDLVSAAIGRCDNARSFSLHCSSFFTDDFPQGVYIEITENCSEFPDFSKWKFLGISQK